MIITEGRKLFKEELKGMKRFSFHMKILDELRDHKTVRFLLKKTRLTLFEITMTSDGNFEFGSTRNGKYTYLFGDFVNAMEKIFDGVCSGEVEMLFLADEIDLSWEIDPNWRTLETGFEPGIYDEELMAKLIQ
jgi:hypothetical protein